MRVLNKFYVLQEGWEYYGSSGGFEDTKSKSKQGLMDLIDLTDSLLKGAVDDNDLNSEVKQINECLTIQDQFMELSKNVVQTVPKFDCEIKDIEKEINSCIYDCSQKKEKILVFIEKHNLNLASEDINWFMVDVDKLVKNLYDYKSMGFDVFKNRQYSDLDAESEDAYSGFLKLSSKCLEQARSIKNDTSVRYKNILGQAEYEISRSMSIESRYLAENKAIENNFNDIMIDGHLNNEIKDGVKKSESLVKKIIKGFKI